MKKKKQLKKKLPLFRPDDIVNEVHQALERDFREAQHVYCLNDDLTLYGFNSQVQNFMKKYVPSDQNKEELEAKTIEKFLMVNEHIGKVNGRLKHVFQNINQTYVRSNLSKHEKIHVRARAIMRAVLGPSVDEERWFRECKNSQGSTVGVSFLDTSPERKLLFPLTVTKEAKPYHRSYMGWDEELSSAVMNYNSYFPIGDVYETVEGSRATTVDKNAEIRRMIAPEPTCNMFLQLGLMQYMYDEMKVFGLDVESLPTLHRQLALESSITLRNATIDWSSASDCNAIELCRWLFPPAWFKIIMALRSPVTVLPDGRTVPLNMVSTMGNAGTFPIETLVFWVYAHATKITVDKPNYVGLFPTQEEFGSVSVFGDDCIVPSYMASEFIEIMTEVGFIINDDKSFYGSLQFRESCGGDYLQGYDVRPFKVKAPQSAKLSQLEPWLYIMTNSLIKKYISYYGELSYVYDKELWRVLFALFRQYKIEIKLVPSFFPDDAGLKLSFDIERFHNQYPMKLSRISRSNHGTVSFSFCRFIFRQKRAQYGHIRYAMWLKKPRHEDVLLHHEETRTQNPFRKAGGYVVAKSLSCHWHVPVVKTLAG
jgi:hypothetical protein